MGIKNSIANMIIVEGQPLWSDLTKAIENEGSLEEITRLLGNGTPTIMRNEHLTIAVTKEREDIIMLLLDRGANIDAVGGIYGTALTAAAFGRRADIVSLLLDRGADINAVGGKYGTALTTAAFCGSMNIVSLLLDRGADINAVGGKSGTALAAAALGGSTDIVSLLLDRGANINEVGGKAGTALAAAALGGRTAIVSLLLDRGADINLVGGKYGSALAVAVLDGNMEIVSLLLELKADVMRVGGSYPTPSGVYPSALDVAHSKDSKADPTLLVLLEDAIGQQSVNATENQPADPRASSASSVISRPPFPMPYTVPSSNKRTLQPNPSLPEILPTEFCVGSNITPLHADIPCRELDQGVLLRSLAALVGLSNDATQAKLDWIQNDVRYFIACNFDFGLAYAAARVAWKHFNEHSMDSRTISIQRGQWHNHVQMLDTQRSGAVEQVYSSSGQVQQELIVSPYSIMPRRLWDLKSNRVVDFRMLHATQSTIENIPTFWAVTHSWTSNMSSEQTTINQHQWPVPLPKGITMKFLRSELLTLGAEYVWIDVVCLRQRSDDDYLERVRTDEWKLDVPTIGNIYRRAARIMRYFNGLGIGFSKRGWDNPRHWLQRAWTLQEIASEHNTINCGIPWDQGQVFLNSRGTIGKSTLSLGKVIKLRSAIHPVIQLAAQVDSPGGCGVYELAKEMTKRHASEPVDKISGLFYLLGTTKLPCYDAQMTTEAFWRQCFHLLPDKRKAEILFDFPYRGSDTQWFPTWAQMLDWPTRDPEYDHVRSQSLPGSIRNVSGEMSLCISKTWVIPDVVFKKTRRQGEYQGSIISWLFGYFYNNPGDPGEYQAKINNRPFGFYPPYLSQEPIDIDDQAVFTLAILDPKHVHNWVVCKAIKKCAGADFDLVGVAEVNVLKKVGVIRTDACSDLLVGGENGTSLLQKMDCLFV